MSGILPCFSHYNYPEKKKIVRCLNARWVDKRFCVRTMCAKCYHQTCSLCSRSICSQCRLAPGNKPESLHCCDREHESDEDSFYGGKEPKYVCRNCRFRCQKCHSWKCNKKRNEISSFERDQSGTYWMLYCDACVAEIDEHKPQEIKRRKR